MLSVTGLLVAALWWVFAEGAFRDRFKDDMDREGKPAPQGEVENFNSIIDEGHGRVTTFLWALYAGLLLWAIAYVIIVVGGYEL
jgi:hypothetical protein